MLDRRDRRFRVLLGIVRVDRRRVHEVHEEARPFNVLQEPDSEAVALVRALDEAGHVRRDERPEPLPRHDPEIRHERREGVIGDLRPRGRDRGDERRLARVRKPDEGHVREELQLERELELDALAARIRAPRRAVRRRREAGVSLSAFAARGHEQRLSLLDEVAEDLPRVADAHDRSDGHRDRKIRPVLPVAVVALPVTSPARGESPLETKRIERVESAVRDERDAAAVSAVPARGPAPGDVLLAPHGDAAITTVASGDVDDRFVDEQKSGLLFGDESRGGDRDVAAKPALVVEVHDPVDLREQGIVLGAADVQSRLQRRAALPDEDRTARHELAGKTLHAEALAVAIAPVAGRTLTFFVCHFVFVSA